MRKSTLFFVLIGIQATLVCFILLHSLLRTSADIPMLEGSALLVRKLELTDFSLFTEARYTRHLSQSDLHTPFQDHPFSLEHFPSGSLVRQPSVKKDSHEKLD